jgi:hypothetical protein
MLQAEEFRGFSSVRRCFKDLNNDMINVDFPKAGGHEFGLEVIAKSMLNASASQTPNTAASCYISTRLKPADPRSAVTPHCLLSRFAT